MGGAQMGGFGVVGHGGGAILGGGAPLGLCLGLGSGRDPDPSQGRVQVPRILRRRRGLALGLAPDAPRVVEFGDPHPAPSPLPGVHSLRVDRGKKVGEAEARWLGGAGGWRATAGLPHSLSRPPDVLHRHAERLLPRRPHLREVSGLSRFGAPSQPKLAALSTHTH